MIKNSLLLVIGLVALAGKPVEKNKDTIKRQDIAEISSEQFGKETLIVPGKKAGPVNINSNLDSVKSVLGKPDREEAAMGSSFMSWYGKHAPNDDQLQIYSHRNMGAKDEAISHVKKIRITSPLYKTKDGIGTGVSLAQISKQFKLVKSVNPPFKDRNQLYDDLNAGISFEIRSDQICTGIIVHEPGDRSFTYINLPKKQ